MCSTITGSLCQCSYQLHICASVLFIFICVFFFCSWMHPPLMFDCLFVQQIHFFSHYSNVVTKLFLPSMCFIQTRFFCLHSSLWSMNLGEHPAAMQHGCAANNINLSIMLYVTSLSLLIQLLNRILSTSIVLHVISP